MQATVKSLRSGVVLALHRASCLTFGRGGSGKQA
jgi:hypothetical protein